MFLVGDVYDYAKYFLKNNADSIPNTYDGNMKLQKLLVLADFINYTMHGEPLFRDQVLAFRNGCVVEKVRLWYKNNYRGLKRDSDAFEPNFTQSEYDVLNMTLAIFGSASAKELSEINHTFNFWKIAYDSGLSSSGFHEKSKSVVSLDSPEDIDRMRRIIDAYKESSAATNQREIINGVTFYYDGFDLNDELFDQLEAFSLSADEDTYSVYLDDGKLVIY